LNLQHDGFGGVVVAAGCGFGMAGGFFHLPQAEKHLRQQEVRARMVRMVAQGCGQGASGGLQRAARQPDDPGPDGENVPA
jgi:hypothetical protein